jgi:hypothetical protein
LRKATQGWGKILGTPRQHFWHRFAEVGAANKKLFAWSAVIAAIAACCILYLAGLVSHASTSSLNVTTQRYDNARTGAYLSETILSTSNVSPATFGKLFTRVVDDEIYAQPLYVHDVSVPSAGTERILNVIYVATVNNSVYAFDADDPGAAAPLWYVNLTGMTSGARPVKNSEVGSWCVTHLGTYPDFWGGNIGIVGTPAIDAKSQTLYVVARTTENGEFVQRLHALDITTGIERPHSPVVIQARIPGTGQGSEDGMLAFNPEMHNQRGALLLANGIVYVTWAAHCDSGPWHGWLMGYDAVTLAQVMAKAVTPNGYGGGIWQSGTGPSADADGNIYISTGNGTVTALGGGEDYGNAFVKLSPFGEVLDWFIPSNYADLNNSDGDLGASGVLLIPNTELLASGSKEGKLYVLNRNKLGHLPVSDSQLVRSFDAGPGWLLGTPTYWDGPGGPYIYTWCSASPGRAYRLKRNAMAKGKMLTEVSTTNIVAQGVPGGILSISANGTTAGTGILWAVLGLGHAKRKPPPCRPACV